MGCLGGPLKGHFGRVIELGGALQNLLETGRLGQGMEYPIRIRKHAWKDTKEKQKLKQQEESNVEAHGGEKRKRRKVRSRRRRENKEKEDGVDKESRKT